MERILTASRPNLATETTDVETTDVVKSGVVNSSYHCTMGAGVEVCD